MSKLGLKDNLYICTTNKMWVCMVDGRFLVSKSGHIGFTRKSSAVQAFKNSKYWEYIKRALKSKHDDMVCKEPGYGYGDWLDPEEGKKIELDVYSWLLENGTLKFAEITPLPEWVDF